MVLSLLILSFNCNIRADEFRSWGANDYGQHGDGSINSTYLPKLSDTNDNWKTAFCGNEFALGIKYDGTLWSWGSNSNGQLGDSLSSPYRAIPKKISYDNDWKKIVCGPDYVIGIKKTGKVWAWGNGSLLNSQTYNNKPFLYDKDTVWSDFALVGSTAIIGIKKNGTLWAWGDNTSNSLGRKMSNQTKAVIIDTLKWLSIASGNLHAVAIRADSSLWTWGGNSNGQLGDGTRIMDTINKIGTDKWIKVACGFNHVLAIRNDHTLWAWGQNNSGQIGDGTYVDKLLPTQVGTDSDWVDISSRFNTSYGIRKDTSLWAWGENSSGQLADGTKNSQSSPEKFSGMTTWSMVAAGTTFAVGFGSQQRSLSVAALSKHEYCKGVPFTISYKKKGVFYSGNSFIAQISDSKGSFTNPTNIGQLDTTIQSNITAIIPPSFQNGTGFRVRVISTNPVFISADEGYDVVIDALPAPKITGENIVCAKSIKTYSCLEQPGHFFTWRINGGSIIQNDNSNRITLRWDSAGTHNIYVTELNNGTGCMDSSEFQVTVNEIANSKIYGNTEVLENQPEVYNCNSQNVTFKWQANGGTISGASSNNSLNVQWGTQGSGKITLILLDTITMCTDTITQDVTIVKYVPVSILGSNNSCENKNEIFHTNVRTNIAYSWNVIGGALQSPADADSASVKWGTAGTGSIALKQTNKSNGFVDSARTNVSINVVPAKPVINASSKFLTSNKTSGNQWYVGGEPLKDSTRNTIYPTKTGLYQVTVTEYGCESLLSDKVYFDMTSVDDVNSANVSIYPNPVGDEMTINFGKNGNYSELEIFDNLGVRVYNQAVNDQENILKIDTKQLSNGIYYIEIKSLLKKQVLRFTVNK